MKYINRIHSIEFQKSKPKPRSLCSHVVRVDPECDRSGWRHPSPNEICLGSAPIFGSAGQPNRPTTQERLFRQELSVYVLSSGRQ
jgi:hypothetical protein